MGNRCAPLYDWKRWDYACISSLWLYACMHALPCLVPQPYAEFFDNRQSIFLHAGAPPTRLLPNDGANVNDLLVQFSSPASLIQPSTKSTVDPSTVERV